jgi:predicted DNA-binding protein
MTTMVRKQVYLRPGQDVRIKDLARARGTTEANIIREAVDMLLAETARRQRADVAWAEARVLMERRASYGIDAEGRREAQADRGWSRDELYDRP